jgi:Flp pilus assembly protein CpaB
MQLATKLVSTRRGTLIAALLIALLAGASILLYLNSYRDSLKAQGAMVTVLVAKKSIPKGTAGNVVAAKDLYTVTTIRESQVLDGAISDPASLRNRVAAREIFEGAQLTATDFGAAGDSLAAKLTDKQRVISVPLDSAHGLIDGIEAGNRVDVYAGFNVIPLDASGRPINGGQARPMLRRILANVPVLAVGDKSGRGATNVSLEVDDVEAAKVAFASDNGKLWLALRPSAGAKASSPGIVTVETMLLGVPPVQILRSVGGRS